MKFQTEEVIELSFDDLVAFASRQFQPFPIEDRHLTVSLMNQFRLLQLPHDDGDAGAISAEHMREEFLRPGKTVHTPTLLRKQKPARETLLHRMKAVANGRLRNLR